MNLSNVNFTMKKITSQKFALDQAQSLGRQLRQMLGARSASRQVTVVVVRHGERLDEAGKFGRLAWSRQSKDAADNRELAVSDPPLTARGREQARNVAEILCIDSRACSLEGSCRGIQLKGHVEVFSSPTLRTMQTAAELCAKLGIDEFVPHYTLNGCAFANEHGVSLNQGTQSQPDLYLSAAASSVSLSCWPPKGDVSLVDQRNERRRGFVQALTELATSTDADVVVAVTHRGVIHGLLHELQPADADKYDVLYCCVLVAVVHWPNDAVPDRPIFKNFHQGFGERQVDDRYQIQEDDEFTTVLREGRGNVLFYCVDRVRRCAKLLKTPERGGEEVEGIGVLCGEMVEMMAVPKQFTGDQNKYCFVNVRPKNGPEGWTEVHNIHLEKDKERLERERQERRRKSLEECSLLSRPIRDMSPKRHEKLLSIAHTVTPKILVKQLQNCRDDFPEEFRIIPEVKSTVLREDRDRQELITDYVRAKHALALHVQGAAP